MKILVADDDTISRRLMESVLSAEGYEVVTAADGEGAAALLCSDGGPRLALLDWMMPARTGRACAAKCATSANSPTSIWCC